MWQEGASYYLAVRTQTDGAIYNVSCIANGSCSLPAARSGRQAMTNSTIRAR